MACGHGWTLNWVTSKISLLICTWSHQYTYVIQTKNTQAETKLNQCHEIQFGMRTLHCVAFGKKKKKGLWNGALCVREESCCNLVDSKAAAKFQHTALAALSAEGPVSLLLLLNQPPLFLASLSSSLPILFFTPSQVSSSLLFSPLTLTFRQNRVDWMVFLFVLLSHPPTSTKAS